MQHEAVTERFTGVIDTSVLCASHLCKQCRLYLVHYKFRPELVLTRIRFVNRYAPNSRGCVLARLLIGRDRQ